MSLGRPSPRGPSPNPDLESTLQHPASDLSPTGDELRPSRLVWLLGWLVGAGLVLAVAGAQGGEAGHFAQAGLLLTPPALLAALLQLGIRHQWARTLAWAWFWLVMLAIGGLSVALTSSALESSSARSNTAPALDALLGPLLFAWLLGVLLTVSGSWWTLGRRLGARLSRGSAAHAQGLVGLIQFTIISLAPLVVLAGQPPLLLIIAHDPSSLGLDRSTSGQLLDMFYSLAWTLPFALLGAGVPLKRSLAAGLARLGLQPLAPRDLALIAGLAVGLVIVLFPLDWLTNWVWELTGWTRTDSTALEHLFEAHSSATGALSVGITAGLGEELVVRGLLQPRLGWFLPNLAFTAAHAYQYGLDGLISVFVTGAVLAWVRQRWNTTASALTHGIYDFILVIGGVLQLPGF